MSGWNGTPCSWDFLAVNVTTEVAFVGEEQRATSLSLGTVRLWERETAAGTACPSSACTARAEILLQKFPERLLL
jgi:hypothetical protein